MRQRQRATRRLDQLLVAFRDPDLQCVLKFRYRFLVAHLVQQAAAVVLIREVEVSREFSITLTGVYSFLKEPVRPREPPLPLVDVPQAYGGYHRFPLLSFPTKQPQRLLQTGSCLVQLPQSAQVDPRQAQRISALSSRYLL